MILTNVRTKHAQNGSNLNIDIDKEAIVYTMPVQDFIQKIEGEVSVAPTQNDANLLIAVQNLNNFLANPPVTTPTPVTIGSNADNVTDYDTNAGIDTTECLSVLLENVGQQDASFNYAGFQYVLEPKEQRTFMRLLDQKSQKYTVFNKLSVDGTNSIIRVVTIQFQ